MDALPICMSTNHIHVPVELQIIVSDMLSRFWEPNPSYLKDQPETLSTEQSV